jgi:hypothetical protein
MKRIHYSTLLLWSLFLLAGPSLSGQEVLISKGFRQQPAGSLLKSMTTAGGDTLEVPFIDDFARGVGYPNDQYWVDHEAFVNHQYPVGPPTIGVVTLDAIDASGDLPPNASSRGYQSDELTSRPLYLDVQPSDSVYLSFYYQSGGRGDTSGGEFQDSLVLQFYAPHDQVWTSVWNAAYSREDSVMYERRPLSGIERQLDAGGEGHRKFFHAMVPIRRSQFLKKGFRFRFLNYASLSPNKDIPSVRSNVDQWHLDFIRLDTARTRNDTIINDIAFVQPLTSMLNNYESIPWSHFPEASVFEMRDSLAITYRNLGDEIWSIYREFDIINRLGDYESFSFTGGSGDDIPPFTTETYPRRIQYSFSDTSDRDSALFEIRSYLITDTASRRAPYRWNDTISYFQKFYDYYAYDDGTAENGYGFYGEGSQNVMVALKYNTYVADTLQAVKMYFNQTLDSASRQTFNIRIWSDDGGEPGPLLYEQENVRPAYEDSLNEFHTYVLREKIALDGAYYVGYQKFTTEMLNVGFDVNRINNDRLFYNLNGAWNQSRIKGTLMIRPVFGKYRKPDATSSDDQQQMEPAEPEIELYPNPVRDRLHVDLENNPYRQYTYSLFDINGRVVVSERRLKPSLYLRDLAPGVYIIQLHNRRDQITVSRKILKTR